MPERNENLFTFFPDRNLETFDLQPNLSGGTETFTISNFLVINRGIERTEFRSNILLEVSVPLGALGVLTVIIIEVGYHVFEVITSRFGLSGSCNSILIIVVSLVQSNAGFLKFGLGFLDIHILVCLKLGDVSIILFNLLGPLVNLVVDSFTDIQSFTIDENAGSLGGDQFCLSNGNLVEGLEIQVCI